MPFHNLWNNHNVWARFCDWSMTWIALPAFGGEGMVRQNNREEQRKIIHYTYSCTKLHDPFQAKTPSVRKPAQKLHRFLSSGLPRSGMGFSSRFP
jgi:hypothetical protein